METLVRLRRFRLMRELASLLGLEVPRLVEVGSGFTLQHRGRGTVINPYTTIGNNVTIYHNVTIGRVDSHRPKELRARLLRIVIEDGVTLYPGCVVLGGEGVTRVGRGTVIGANAVLTSSTGEFEVWAGVPARKIGSRPEAEIRMLRASLTC